MPAMLRKSGLQQLKKFKQFINKGGGDISKKLNDKTVTNTLDKKIAVSDNEPGGKTDKHLKNLSKKSIIGKANEEYQSDEEIESQYDDFTVSELTVYEIREDGSTSGIIELYFPSQVSDDDSWFSVDNWMKYAHNSKIAFDNWYPEKTYLKLCEIINKEIKKQKFKRNVDKFNL